MSLLLEALKKAELAKQAAKEPPTDSAPFTRDKLPDINQPLEIHSEDLQLAQPTAQRAQTNAQKPALELALEEPVSPAPAAPPPAARPAPLETDFMPPEEPLERKQAQQLFEVKEMDVNPRKPFYIVMGLLGVFALGTVGYFWYQLQPRSSFLAPKDPSQQSAPPPPPQAAAPAAPAPLVLPGATPAAPGSTQANAAQAAAAPGKNGTAAKATAPASTAAAVGARTATTRRDTATTPTRQARPAGDINITPAKPQLDPTLQAAYQAFGAGDIGRAREGYLEVLRASPNNRDALLGMAAVEMQSKHYEAAGNLYTRLLELDPRDAYALAALMGLRGDADPLNTESRVKTLIAAQPDASFLQFTLGNQYAAQGRWDEAQQAYFRAYSGDPEHPDFAYNLAVSLDKLHQSKPALEYYRRALALAQKRPATFDKTQVSKRATQLEH